MATMKRGACADPGKLCKCNNKAKSGLLCVKCDTIYHNSCANNTVKMCAVECRMVESNNISLKIVSPSVGDYMESPLQCNVSTAEIRGMLHELIKTETGKLYEEIMNLKLEVMSLKINNDKCWKLLKIIRKEIKSRLLLITGIFPKAKKSYGLRIKSK